MDRETTVYALIFGQGAQAKVLKVRLENVPLAKLTDTGVRNVLEKARTAVMETLEQHISVATWWPGLSKTDRRGQTLRKDLRQACGLAKVAFEHVQPHQHSILHEFEDVLGRLTYLGSQI